VLDLRGNLRVADATDGYNGRPAPWMRSGQAPGALTTHRDARQINPCRVHPVILLDLVEYGQDAFSILRTSHPAALVRLRKDREKRKCVLLPFDHGTEAHPDLVTAVSPGLASAVKKNDERKWPRAVVIVRDEQHVFCRV